MTTVAKFNRTRVDGQTAALALTFDTGPAGPEHDVTTIEWSSDAIAALNRLDEDLRHRDRTQRLPIQSLRMRISISDPDLLRLDLRLGLISNRTIAWTAANEDDASGRLQSAVAGWLVNEFAGHNGASMNERLEGVRQLVKSDALFRVERRRSRVFDWTHTRSGTTKLGAANPQGYSDLADFAARQIEGKELFPNCGPMKRLVSGHLGNNEAELMTKPIMVGRSLFSLVLHLKVLSYPGRGTPIVELAFSKRFWMRKVRTPSAGTVSAFAMPGDRNVALEFSLSRQRARQGPSFPYESADGFSPIARHFGLPPDMTAREVVGRGYLLEECPLLVVNSQGVGERLDNKTGVPDRDKLEGFMSASEVLKPFGLHPWQGLTAIETPSRSIKNRNQGWRKAETVSSWRDQMHRHIDSCYGGSHHIVLGYYDSCYEDGIRVRDKLIGLLGDRICLQLVPIQGDVHGPQKALPNYAGNGTDRARLRAKCWQPFVEQVRRYQRDARRPIDGVLIIAPEWYELDGRRVHDDPVNKRAGRIAVARDLQVPVQYLRPYKEGKPRDLESDFDTRTVAAWLDLAWGSLGRIDPAGLEKILARIYGGAAVNKVEPPDRVLALTILRRNSTRRRRNEQSFVPAAIELDLRKGTCSARFARRKEEGSIEYSPQRAMPLAITELAASGPITLDSSRERRGESSQSFFYEAITEFCNRATNPLVIIDADTCRSAWPWLQDSNLDPNNVLMAGHPHAEADWGDARILRVRTANAPKVLLDGYAIGEEIEGPGRIEYSAPKRSDAQVYQIDDSVADVYLSFGSLLRTGLKQGLSCYRSVELLKQDDGSPRRTYTIDQRQAFTGAWSTPSAVEFTTVRTAPGEHSNQLAALAEGLRSLFVHTGDWTTRPAPLFFERVLKDYLADYSIDEAEWEEGDTP